MRRKFSLFDFEGAYIGYAEGILFRKSGAERRVAEGDTKQVPKDRRGPLNSRRAKRARLKAEEAICAISSVGRAADS